MPQLANVARKAVNDQPHFQGEEPVKRKPGRPKSTEPKAPKAAKRPVGRPPKNPNAQPGPPLERQPRGSKRVLEEEDDEEEDDEDEPERDEPERDEPDDEEEGTATYEPVRKPRVRSTEPITQQTFNSPELLKQWLETVVTSEKTLKAYMSTYTSKIVFFKNELEPGMTPYQFFRNRLGDLLDSIKQLRLMLNTKKQAASNIVWFFDNVPLFYEDNDFIKSKEVQDFRVYNSIMKIKSSDITELNKGELYFPMTYEVKQRILEKYPENNREKTYALIMMEFPVRNDLVLQYTDIEDKEGPNNYLFIPANDLEPCQIKLNDFKTKGFKERYIVNYKVSDELNDVIRHYVNKTRKGRLNEYVFFSDKKMMAQMNKDIIQTIGFDRLDGGANFWRRLAVSNMQYEIDNGRKTLEDKVKLAQLMQHTVEAADKSYLCPISDGSYQGKRSRTIICNEIQRCLQKDPEVIKDILGITDGEHKEADD